MLSKAPDGASQTAMTGYGWMQHGLGCPMQASECGANCAMDPQPFSWGPTTLFNVCSLRDTAAAGWTSTEGERLGERGILSFPATIGVWGRGAHR
jgi:hypothetical protein